MPLIIDIIQYIMTIIIFQSVTGRGLRGSIFVRERSRVWYLVKYIYIYISLIKTLLIADQNFLFVLKNGNDRLRRIKIIMICWLDNQMLGILRATYLTQANLIQITVNNWWEILHYIWGRRKKIWISSA